MPCTPCGTAQAAGATTSSLYSAGHPPTARQSRHRSPTIVVRCDGCISPNTVVGRGGIRMLVARTVMYVPSGAGASASHAAVGPACAPCSSSVLAPHRVCWWCGASLAHERRTQRCDSWRHAWQLAWRVLVISRGMRTSASRAPCQPCVRRSRCARSWLCASVAGKPWLAGWRHRGSQRMGTRWLLWLHCVHACAGL